MRQGLEDGAGCRAYAPACADRPEGAVALRSHATVASEIEAALYALYAGASSDYRQHARMLRPGLKALRPKPAFLRRLSAAAG